RQNLEASPLHPHLQSRTPPRTRVRPGVQAFLDNEARVRKSCSCSCANGQRRRGTAGFLWKMVFTLVTLRLLSGHVCPCGGVSGTSSDPLTSNLSPICLRSSAACPIRS